MGHFAQLNEDNIVIQVIVLDNNKFNDDEETGIQYLKNMFGDNTVWKQTSYNSNLRLNFASIGCEYLEDEDIFRSPQPFPSWSYDFQLNGWIPPVSYPNDNKEYVWNEEAESWIEIEGGEPQPPDNPGENDSPG